MQGTTDTRDRAVLGGPAKPRLAYIDTLRGFAALWVFLLHVHGYWLDNVRPPTLSVDGLLVRVMGFGGAGVDLFIVLSGFCLTLPLIRDGVVREIDSRRFFRRRAFRLLPAFYAAVFLVMALELVAPLRALLVARDLTWVDAVTHLTLTFPLSGQTLGSVNGSLWSISLEATLYLGFPTLLLLHRSGGIRRVLRVTLVIAIAWAAFAVWWTASPHPWDLLSQPNKLFPGRWIQFALGMWAATLVRNASPEHAQRAGVALPVATVIGLLGYSRGWDLANNLGFGVVGMCVLILLARLPDWWFSRGPLRLLTSLGVISYSFYLVHQPILLLTASLARPGSWGIPATLAVALLVAGGATVGVAALLYRAVERPFLVRGSMKSVIRDARRPHLTTAGEASPATLLDSD